MRFVAAPWIGMLEDGSWLDNARHANRCARQLSAGLQALPGVELAFPTEANAVFARMPDTVVQALREKGWRFYTFIAAGGVRLMCSWATIADASERLIDDVRSCLEGSLPEA